VPQDSPYLVVYPFEKVRPWYALLEDRQRAMDEHIRIGARVPTSTTTRRTRSGSTTRSS
jgi:chlorite dismutase